LLREANSLHQCLAGHKLFPTRTLCGGGNEASVCCMAMRQKGKRTSS
jgi:hypothetical protein